MLNRARLLKKCLEAEIEVADNTPTYRLCLLLKEYNKEPRVRKCGVCKKPLSKYNPNDYCFAHIMAGFKKEQQDDADTKYKAKVRREHASKSSNERATEGAKGRTPSDKSKPKGKGLANKRRRKTKV